MKLILAFGIFVSAFAVTMGLVYKRMTKPIYIELD